MVELLGCPFCGSPARDDLLPHAAGPGWVQCSSCECDQRMSDTLEEAVARWNTRAPHPLHHAQAAKMPAGDTMANCARFVRWALQEGPWEGGDLDGGAVQDKAELLGLIVSVPYDPEKHGAYNNCGCDAGDPWFEFSPGLNAIRGPALPSTSRGTLQDAAQRLADELLAQHISRDKFTIGVGSDELHAYIRLARVNCRADVIDGWPVVWHFNVGPAVAHTSTVSNTPEGK